ncbi:MAG: hypothetical protein ABIA63_04700 [bacterium]
MNRLIRFCLLVSLNLFFIITILTGYGNKAADGVEYYAFVPGFTSSHSIWSGLGITDDDQVYISVSDHTDQFAFYHFNPADKSMDFIGEFDKMVGINFYNWQGKVHTVLEWDAVRKVFYFGTDAGEDKGGTILDHPVGYHGGMLCSFDPQNKLIRILSTPSIFNSVKGLLYSKANDRIGFIMAPEAKMGYYDIKTGKTRDLGRMNGWHVPRIMMKDKWGNMYSVDAYGYLNMIHHKSGELMRLTLQLPHLAETKENILGAGISAFAMSPDGERLFAMGNSCNTFFEYRPSKDSVGEIVWWEATWGDKNKPYIKSYNSSALAFYKNRLYYAIGGHGSFVNEYGVVWVIEYDIETRNKKLVRKLDNSVITECTGSNVLDSKGYIYFGGHGQSLYSQEFSEGGTVKMPPAKPYLVRFHPDSLNNK